jgi:YD repeat-containing protein
VPTVTLSFGYDAFGNRTSLSDSLGGSISYAFDAANRLTSLAMTVNGSTAAQVTLGYDAANRLTGLTRTAPSVSGDTITTSYSYDNANRLTNITYTDVTKALTLSSYTYGYDKASELTSYQDNSGNSLTYGYDVNGELTGATATLAGSNYTFTYNYDHNGNRTSTSTDVNGTLTSATYTTGSDNELTSDGTYTYTYDADGNMTSQTNIHTGSVTYYTWDYRNRLTEVKQGNSDEKFTYDVNNSRIAISLNGTTQLYTVYDGANPYMDFNGSGTLTERYLTNPNVLSQLYGQVSASGTTQWFLTDNINSIRQVVSTSGSSLDTITYDSYGTILNQTNSANAPRFGFASGAVDSITGNDQFDARYFYCNRFSRRAPPVAAGSSWCGDTSGRCAPPHCGVTPG